MLKFGEESDTGELNYIQGVGSALMPVHLHKLNLGLGLHRVTINEDEDWISVLVDYHV